MLVWEALEQVRLSPPGFFEMPRWVYIQEFIGKTPFPQEGSNGIRELRAIRQLALGCKCPPKDIP